MNAVEIIARKRDGNKLSRDEIYFFVKSFLAGDVKDYQMSAFLMAVCIKGMDFDETGWLTDVMLNTGKVMTLTGAPELYVDKHSSGGVGDKVSLILAPWVAACGVRVPMLSGRGLGHTGGTLDKLESIPGFRTDLSLEEFTSAVDKVGCVISGQTPEIAPADRMMYALRDVTGTVESIPLICASILSKKFAAGPNGLVFDVKCGNGAFMKTLYDAQSLANNLIGVCKAMSKQAQAIITDMNQPLGYAAGNLLEVVEAIHALTGAFAPDLYTVTLELAIEMLLISRISKERQNAVSLLESKLGDGSAYRKFEEMVEYQGGDLSIFRADAKLPSARHVTDFKAADDGYISGFETEGIGRLIVDMGGGRKTKDDPIDGLVGLIFHKKIGDPVERGESIVEIHASNSSMGRMVSERLQALVRIGDERVIPRQLILKRIA